MDFEKPLNKSKHSFSIVIIARNESERIVSCLQSVINNSFPKNQYEIVLVDDDSDDDTIALAKGLHIENLTILRLQDYPPARNSSAFKKNGIAYAIHHARFDWVVTTDADCIVPDQWLATLDAYIQDHSELLFVAMPIDIISESKAISDFQTIDNIGSMALTALGVKTQKFYLANGANLAFEKSIYNLLENKLQKELASGDDIFLIQALSKYKKGAIAFLKSQNVMVKTHSISRLNAFLTQRKRWASKTKAYDSSRITFIGMIVFLLSTSILFNLIIALVIPELLWVLALQLIIKFCIDYMFINRLSLWFGHAFTLKTFLTTSLIHPIYHVYMGIQVIFGKTYTWKGRKVN